VVVSSAVEVVVSSAVVVVSAAVVVVAASVVVVIALGWQVNRFRAAIPRRLYESFGLHSESGQHSSFTGLQSPCTGTQVAVVVDDAIVSVT
jgi:hypothetical protein